MNSSVLYEMPARGIQVNTVVNALGSPRAMLAPVEEGEQTNYLA